MCKTVLSMHLTCFSCTEIGISTVLVSRTFTVLLFPSSTEEVLEIVYDENNDLLKVI